MEQMSLFERTKMSAFPFAVCLIVNREIMHTSHTVCLDARKKLYMCIIKSKLRHYACEFEKVSLEVHLNLFNMCFWLELF